MVTFFIIIIFLLGSLFFLFLILFISDRKKINQLSIDLKQQIKSFESLKAEIEERHKQEPEVPTVIHPKNDNREFQETDKFEIFCIKYQISKKEKEIIRELLKGFECKEIATKQCKSIHTVRNHIRHIYRKCTVQNRVELINRINGVM